MERRRTKRLTVNLKAERITCTKNCSVFIENLSESGIYMITAPAKNNDYVPGSEIDLELELKDGNIISLNCLVKWAVNNSPDDLTNSVGLEIVDPPSEYREFISTLH
ncbi:MAG: PilZ domain-containing protein [Nitrospiraceae bacterium]|nr:MAG: PilZ domain-containing protein [Nitrospiraceae bacterium]